MFTTIAAMVLVAFPARQFLSLNFQPSPPAYILLPIVVKPSFLSLQQSSCRLSLHLLVFLIYHDKPVPTLPPSSSQPQGLITKSIYKCAAVTNKYTQFCRSQKITCLASADFHCHMMIDINILNKSTLDYA